ncbi:FitA-like ribbon-helix-helix domain-containing protein [Saccharopolyspora karakumensis]|uniref:FitA-like ribbon-helix-helix domain-containing protein n=1 Tax=Saccharopolyspora karakumensis TaxID=2530386 RepID=UPI0038B644F7
MPVLTIRGPDDETIEHLGDGAARYGHTMEAEAVEIIGTPDIASTREEPPKQRARTLRRPRPPQTASPLSHLSASQ